MAALGSQSIASSYEQLLHVDRDGGGNTTTHVSIKDGDNGTTFGFTIASDALMMTSTNRLEFGDTGTYIHQSADGVLDLVSDTEIELTATTIDLNGAVAMDGAITGGTNITISGELDAATLDISGNADIAGTTNLDAVDIDGNVQLDGTFTVGTDGSGQDVTFYSATSGDSFAWDASEEKLTITGTNGQTALDVADGNLVVADNVDIEGDIDVNGTSNLDVVDIDGAVDMASTLQVDGAITSSAGATITTADNTDTLSLVSTDADANSGPNLRLYRNSASPADSDKFGQIDFEGRNDNSQDFVATQIIVNSGDVSDGSEDAQIEFDVMTGGTLREYLRMASGSQPSIVFNQDGQDIDFTIESDDNAEMFKIDAADNTVTITQGQAAVPLTIDQNADSSSILIDSESTSANVLNMASAATTTGNIINLNACDALTTGKAIYIDSNSSDNSTRNLVEIVNNHTSATGATALKVQQDAAAHAMLIDQNANDYALEIASDGTTATSFEVGSNSLTTGTISHFYSASADNSTRNLVKITNDHASADNAVGLYIQQDGADASIELAGNGSIKFPGTQGASSDANSLDDYEEGTFTLTVASASGTIGLNASLNTCSYVKIGRLVHIQAYVHNNTFSSTPSGTITFSGLPFSTGDRAEGSGQGQIMYKPAGSSADAVYIAAIPENAAGANVQGQTADGWDADVDIYISGTYQTA